MDLKLKHFSLNREFYTIEMINYLQNRGTSFIMPCVKRGPRGGIRNLLTGRGSYSTEYTMHSKDNEATFQVNIVVKYSKRKIQSKWNRTLCICST
jgi:putative transposase